jgi:hypothetical protein
MISLQQPAVGVDGTQAHSRKQLVDKDKVLQQCSIVLQAVA